MLSGESRGKTRKSRDEQLRWQLRVSSRTVWKKNPGPRCKIMEKKRAISGDDRVWALYRRGPVRSTGERAFDRGYRPEGSEKQPGRHRAVRGGAETTLSTGTLLDSAATSRNKFQVIRACLSSPYKGDVATRPCSCREAPGRVPLPRRAVSLTNDSIFCNTVKGRKTWADAIFPHFFPAKMRRQMVKFATH